MSVLPIIFDDNTYLADVYDWDFWPLRRRRGERRYPDPFYDFPLTIHPRQLKQRRQVTSDSAPTIDDDGFQVSLDIQKYKPDEVTVKTVDDSIVVEGKHDEHSDEHGYVSRQFTRRYILPEGYDPNSVCSTMSSDGVLTIKAPPPQQLESNERVVSIQQTGSARLNDDEKGGDKKEGDKAA